MLGGVVMSKHTPGPWRIVRARGASKAAINGAQIRTEAGLHITSITHVADKPISQKAADARLIAAAPEMLEALRMVVRHLHAPGGDGYEELLAAERAIAKAEGK